MVQNHSFISHDNWLDYFFLLPFAEC
jgi:hypothetical protein